MDDFPVTKCSPGVAEGATSPSDCVTVWPKKRNYPLYAGIGEPAPCLNNTGKLWPQELYVFTREMHCLIEEGLHNLHLGKCNPRTQRLTDPAPQDVDFGRRPKKAKATGGQTLVVADKTYWIPEGGSPVVIAVNKDYVPLFTKTIPLWMLVGLPDPSFARV